MGEPLVSFLVAALDAESTIKRAVASALVQTHHNIEVVVVDDGSQDSTREVVLSIADDRVKVVRLPETLGRSSARNIGIAECRGDFLAILDADDECLPNRLKETLGVFRSHPDTVAVGGQMFCRWGSELRPSLGWPTDPTAISARFRSGHMGIAHPTATVRAPIIRRFGGYAEGLRWAEDFELFRRIAGSCEIRSVSEPIVIYERPPMDSFNYLLTTEMARMRVAAAPIGSSPSPSSWINGLARASAAVLWSKQRLRRALDRPGTGETPDEAPR